MYCCCEGKTDWNYFINFDIQPYYYTKGSSKQDLLDLIISYNKKHTNITQNTNYYKSRTEVFISIPMQDFAVQHDDYRFHFIRDRRLQLDGPVGFQNLEGKSLAPADHPLLDNGSGFCSVGQRDHHFADDSDCHSALRNHQHRWQKNQFPKIV